MINTILPEKTLDIELMYDSEREAYDFPYETYRKNQDILWELTYLFNQIRDSFPSNSDFYCSDCDMTKKLIFKQFENRISEFEDYVDIDRVCMIDASNTTRHRLGYDLIIIEDEENVRKRLGIEFPKFEKN